MKLISGSTKNYVTRGKNRFITIACSSSIVDFFNNVTANVFDFITILPLLLYIITPALVVFSLGRQPRLYIINHYVDVLSSVFPLIMISYIAVIILLIGKSVTSHINLWHQYFSHPVYILFLLAMVWMAISICVNSWTDISPFGDNTRHEGMLTYYGYIAVLFFLGSLVRNGKIKCFLCNASLCVSLAVAVFAIERYYITSIDYLLDDSNPAGIFIHFNHYGYYLAIHIILAVGLYISAKSQIWRIIYLLCMSVNSLVLCVNNTFGAWLACVFGFMFLLIATKIKDGKANCRVLVCAICFVGITALVSLTSGGTADSVAASAVSAVQDANAVAGTPSGADGAGNGRWLLWKVTVQDILQRPLFGYGIEGISAQLWKVLETERPHNEYLQYAVTFGVPEAVLYVMACVAVFLHNVRHKNIPNAGSLACLAAAFTYLVSAFFGITIYNVTPFFFIFLGLGYNSSPHAWKREERC